MVRVCAWVGGCVDLGVHVCLFQYVKACVRGGRGGVCGPVTSSVLLEFVLVGCYVVYACMRMCISLCFVLQAT
jgi:hypothetical protein